MDGYKSTFLKTSFVRVFLPHLLFKWPPRSSCLNSRLKRKQAMNIKIDPRRRIWAIIIEVANTYFTSWQLHFICQSKVEASQYMTYLFNPSFNSINTVSGPWTSLTVNEIRLSRYRHPSHYIQENGEFYFVSASSTKLWILSSNDFSLFSRHCFIKLCSDRQREPKYKNKKNIQIWNFYPSHSFFFEVVL